MKKLSNEQIEILGRYADYLIEKEKDKPDLFPIYLTAGVIITIGIIEFIKWL
jgi:hypothetical protein